MGHIRQEFRFVFAGQLQIRCFLFYEFCRFFEFSVFLLYLFFLLLKDLGLFLEFLIRSPKFFLLGLESCFRLFQRSGLLFQYTPGKSRLCSARNTMSSKGMSVLIT